MQIRRSAKMLAENLDCAWPGFKKRIWLSEKQLLNLRCHRITMVQAIESRKGLNLPFTRRANFCRPTCWRVLRESEMRPVLVIQLDNATPIILNREKSVTFGTLGTLALWLFTKPSPEIGELCFSVASLRTQGLGSCRARTRCLMRWRAAVR